MTVVNTEGYTASAAQAREATEKSVESWKRNVRTFTDQARKAEELADEQAEQAEQAAKEQEREVKRAERAAAKQAREQAREPYEGLTKAELSDQLAERGLPKTGTVEELIERLVGSDNSDSSDSE